MIQKARFSKKRVMEISGHKTHSILERYNIVSFVDIKESGEKLDEWVRQQSKKGI